VTGFCDHGKEPLDFIKCGEYLDTRGIVGFRRMTYLLRILLCSCIHIYCTAVLQIELSFYVYVSRLLLGPRYIIAVMWYVV
jgi:hypothetical protein